MNPIESALLALVAHRAETHHRWANLIAQATPTADRRVSAVAVASPRRTRLVV
jgi:hypothetical protein